MKIKKQIPVKCLQEISNIFMPQMMTTKSNYRSTLSIKLAGDTHHIFFDTSEIQPVIEWIDVKGINTPYLVTILGAKQ